MMPDEGVQLKGKRESWNDDVGAASYGPEWLSSKNLTPQML